MDRQAEHIFSPDADPVDPGTLENPNMLFLLLELTHGDMRLGG